MLATLFTHDGKGPDGLFVGDADPRATFAIVRGYTKLTMGEFVHLNHRDSLADALGPGRMIESGVGEL